MVDPTRKSDDNLSPPIPNVVPSMANSSADKNRDEPNERLDMAARAGWLYYVAGRRQDEIASILGVSRQSAQRLVSLAMSSRLVRVHIEHPISRLMELESALKGKFGFTHAQVVPTDPYSQSTTVGVVEAGALEIERRLRSPEPKIFAMGTGRTLKGAIDLLPQMNCPQHRIVSLAGNIAPDGSASYYNVIFAIADASHARSFPIPLPVVASSAEEREMLQKQPLVVAAHALAERADVAFVGVGDLGPDAPLFADGFVTEAELSELRTLGGVGEICGWAFDAKGDLLKGGTNLRVASGALPPTRSCEVIALAKGALKLPGIRAAATGHLINGLITDETTAESLLAD